MASRELSLTAVIEAIAQRDSKAVDRLLAARPGLVAARVGDNADGASTKEHFNEELHHQIYDGDSALHLAAAAHEVAIVRRLIAAPADVRAKNRRAAEPLHYAVDGEPGSARWRPEDQAQTVMCLLAAGADPNAVDQGGVTPLHRAVRNRCAAAVRALLEGGADPRRKNKNGSTVAQLITQTTGRGGTGSKEAKAQQEEIARLLSR